MSDGFVQGHHLLGIQGLALLRAGAARRLDGVQERLREIRAIVAHLDGPPYSQRRDLPASEVGAGYDGWAASYDDPGNDTIALEQPAVRALLDELPSGPVLDAACGTGRHTAYLAASGRAVVGVDASEAMLARARAKLPGADLRWGELTALPFDDETGARSMIPEHPHLHGAYLSAFVAAGLVARRLVEPALTREQARAHAKNGYADAFEDALAGVPAVIVWDAERG
jgi:SAM-dependent methyltransferase